MKNEMKALKLELTVYDDEVEAECPDKIILFHCEYDFEVPIESLESVLKVFQGLDSIVFNTFKQFADYHDSVGGSFYGVTHFGDKKVQWSVTLNGTSEIIMGVDEFLDAEAWLQTH